MRRPVVSFEPFRKSVVPNRRSTCFDGRGQDCPDCLSEAVGGDTFEVDPRSLRVDPGSMQSLVGVDVPDSGQHRLVKQGDFDGSPGSKQPLVKHTARDIRGFGAQSGEKTVVKVPLVPSQVNTAEPSRIDEGDPNGVSFVGNEVPDHMPVGWDGSDPSDGKIQPAGHAEANHQAASPFESEEELLAPPIDRLDPPSRTERLWFQPTPASTIQITDHVTPGDGDPIDPPPGHCGCEDLTDRFDFGEFRHAAGFVRSPVTGSIGSGRCGAGLYSPGARFRVGPHPDGLRSDVLNAGSGTRMTESSLHQEDPVAAATAVREIADRIRGEVGKVIVGQEEVVEEVLLAIFCGGHAIIEGVPGLAKTLLVHTLASTLGLEFSRIQFTPDLMPTDMTGTEVIEEDKSTGRRELRFVPGPIFANVILADEINRTPPKTQGALLEAMQERQVTVGGETHILPEPFFVLATQNPIEQEGTYPLPEAQLDRFMFNIRIGYPTEQDELAIVQKTTAESDASVSSLLSAKDCLRIQQLVRQVPIADHVARYALRLVRSTRVRESREDKPEIVRNYLAWGAGPRASQFLVLAAKARALLIGATHVTPELVKSVALPVMRHRIIANFNAEADGITTDDVVRRLLEITAVDDADPSTRSTLDSVTR